MSSAEEVTTPKKPYRSSTAMKRVRNAKGLLQEEMAEKLGISTSTVANCERESRLPASRGPRNELQKMAQEANEVYP